MQKYKQTCIFTLQRCEILIWNSGHCFSIYTPPPVTQMLSFSLTFSFSNSLPHLISHLSPFLWSWFIQREGMVSIIYSIPTHLWPWLMHHWPNRSLCQARHRIQYSTHTCMLPNTHTQKITGQWVQACTHIHSLSLSASPMDTWQQECTIINLNWSQTIGVLKWLNFIWSLIVAFDDETALTCVIFITKCLDLEQTANSHKCHKSD